MSTRDKWQGRDNEGVYTAGVFFVESRWSVITRWQGLYTYRNANDRDAFPRWIHFQTTLREISPQGDERKEMITRTKSDRASKLKGKVKMIETARVQRVSSTSNAIQWASNWYWLFSSVEQMFKVIEEIQQVLDVLCPMFRSMYNIWQAVLSKNESLSSLFTLHPVLDKNDSLL